MRRACKKLTKSINFDIFVPMVQNSNVLDSSFYIHLYTLNCVLTCTFPFVLFSVLLFFLIQKRGDLRWFTHRLSCLVFNLSMQHRTVKLLMFTLQLILTVKYMQVFDDYSENDLVTDWTILVRVSLTLSNLSSPALMNKLCK